MKRKDEASRESRRRLITGVTVAFLFLLAAESSVAAPPSNTSNAKAVSATPPCNQQGTPKDDEIVCDSDEESAVESGNGDDSVSVSVGATLDVKAVKNELEVIAIDTGDDNDYVNVGGEVKATSAALEGGARPAPALGAVNKGAKSGTDVEKDTVKATAISTGTGDDIIENPGAVTANAISVSTSLGLVNDARSVSTEAAGIDAGEGDDTVVSSGSVSVRSAASIEQADVLPGKGSQTDFADSSRSANAVAVGIRGGDGDDHLRNDGEIVVVATTITGGFDVNAKSSGNATVLSTSEAESHSTGVAGDEGIDTIENNGTIRAVATASSGGANISVQQSGKSEKSANSWDGDPSATAKAVGIDGGTGNDGIDNTGTVTASSLATAGDASISVASSNVESAGAASKAAASATGIEGGVGDDTIDNSGTVRADSAAIAVGLGVDVSMAGKAKVETEAGTVAEASATGIGGDEGASTETPIRSTNLSPNGLELVVGTSELAVAGDDVITNSGSVTATATTVAGELAAAVGVGASGSASVNTKSSANATGIDAGDGDDRIVNNGVVDSVASAVAVGVEASVSINPDEDDQKVGDTDLKGLFKDNQAAVEGSVTAEATATGISADGDSRSKGSTTTTTLSLEGISIERESFDITADGDDFVSSNNRVTATATAIAGSLSTAVGINDAAEANAGTASKSLATGIATAGGNDTVFNTATVVATSTAISRGREVSVSVEGDAKVSAKAGTTADASAIGISTDGDDDNSLLSSSLELGLDGLSISRDSSTTGSAGDDLLGNGGDVVAVATAISGELAAPVAIGGSASGEAGSTATSSAIAATTGGGDDVIRNAGSLTAVATSIATGLNAAISVEGERDDSENPPTPPTEEKKPNASAKTNVSADATAVGLSADEVEFGTTSEFDLSISADELAVSSSNQGGVVGGDDVIDNSGAVTAVATATAQSIGIAVNLQGDASAEAMTSAKSNAIGINAGDGTDRLINRAAVTAVATSFASSAEIAFSPKGGVDTTSESGTTADARATGITMDGEGRSTLTETSLTIGSNGLTFDRLRQDLAASGDDYVLSESPITAVSTAIAGELSGALTQDGTAKADAVTAATASSIGADLGGGNDTMDNFGAVTAVANAIAFPIEAELTEKSESADKKSLADTGKVATATAIGISTDGADADHTRSIDVDITVDEPSLSAHYLDTKTAASGNDSLTNNSAITAVATANMPAIDVAISKEGQAAALSTAESTASAIGVDLGAGDDYLDTAGRITAVAEAGAVAVNVAVAPKGNANTADAIWSGGTSATASATGVSGDGEHEEKTTALDVSLDTDKGNVTYVRETSQASGNEDIKNFGVIDSVAVAGANSISVAYTKKGVASAASQSSAFAESSGIDAGAGDDRINNLGMIRVGAIAEALSAAISISKSGVSAAGNAVWDGGVLATAIGNGIDVAGTGLTEHSETSFDVNFGTTSVVDGIPTKRYAAALSRSVSSSSATSSNSIDNTGGIAVTTLATSSGIAADVVTSSGVAGALATSTAHAESSGILSGVGKDTITNDGNLIVQSIANANSVNGTFSKSGTAVSTNALADTGTSASAYAVGIDSEASAELYERETTLEALRTVRTEADGAETISNSVSLNVEERTNTFSDRDLDTSDTITNSGVIAATAVANSNAVAAAVTQSGVAVSGTAASTSATAKGIVTGSGEDDLTNFGVIAATGIAITNAASVSVNKSGLAATENSLWDGSVSANASATGIETDSETRVEESSLSISASNDGIAFAKDWSVGAEGADDDVDNYGVITSQAIAVNTAITGAGTLAGASAALGTSNATAEARGIRTGGGDDTIDNYGVLTSTAAADANSLNVSFAKSGVALAGDAIFAGGTRASANAIGIASDGESSTAFESTAAELDENGFAVSFVNGDTANNGIDTINNTGVIVTTAAALAPSVAVSVTQNGVAASATDTVADARATGIAAGGESDTVNNSGEIVTTAFATADAVSVSGSFNGAAAAGGGLWSGGMTATSDAVGIEGDGEGRNYLNRKELSVSEEEAHLLLEESDLAASGDDTIDNTGDIVTTSVAFTPSLNVSAVIQAGVAASVATSTADARGVGMEAGSGNDTVSNSGNIVTTAVGAAQTLSASYASIGGAISSDAIFSGGTTARAEAVGIDGDADTLDYTSLVDLTVSEELVALIAARSETGASGNDTITNEGDIEAVAVTASGSRALAVTPTGLAVSVTASTAESRASGIDGGAGADTIINRGDVGATSVAEADTISVAFTPGGVAVAGNNVWDGGATARATAYGIDGDGEGIDHVQEAFIGTGNEGFELSASDKWLAASGNDYISNVGTVRATSVAVTPSLGVAVAPAGGAIAVSRATAESRAVALGAGAGDDEVYNLGVLNADAIAVAVAGNVAFAGTGVAVAADAIFDGGTTARAEAIGIDTDGTGIDTIFETAANVSSDGQSASASLHFETGTTEGKDFVDNDNDISATAVAVAPSVAVSVTPAGLAGAITTATAEARATGIDTGGGDDIIENNGVLNVDAVANADTVSVSVTPGGGALAANALWNGGVTAESDAVGIDADGRGTGASLDTSLTKDGSDISFSFDARRTVASGNDDIKNYAAITATSTAVTPSVGVAVAPAGVTVAATTATARARSAAIKAGPGDDDVYNEGLLDVNSTAVATSVNVSVAPAGLALAGNDVWDGGTTADAYSVGIETDGAAERHVRFDMNTSGIDDLVNIRDHISYTNEIVESAGDDTVTNIGDIDSQAVAVSPAATVSVAVWGVSGAISTATAQSEARGIDTGGGIDDIDNSGNITSQATSIATAVNVSVTVGGTASTSDAIWDGGTTAIAKASAIDAGSGDDMIENHGILDARSVAVAPSVSVPVGIFGVATSTSTSTADAESFGILGGDGDDTIDNFGRITAGATANATAVSIPVNIFGVAGSTNDFWDGGVRSSTRAAAIFGGDGNNTIFNDEFIEAFGRSVTPNVSVAFSVGGVAGAISTSTAESDIYGILTGSGNDSITSLGRVSADARSTAVTVGTAISVFGAAGALDSFWNGGTTADAFTRAIASGDGNDLIDNYSIAEANSLARANSDQISGTLIGVAASIATSNSTGLAYGLDGGLGDDTLINRGEAIADSDARATSVAIGVSGIGAAGALDAFWDGGTTADSDAIALFGDLGDDWLINLGDASATSYADTDSVDVAVSAGLLSASYASSQATSHAYGLSGGAGTDAIYSSGNIVVDSTADAGAVGVSVTGIGAAFAGSFFDETTLAQAFATGASGGMGDDSIVATEDAATTVTATASTKAKDISVVAVTGFANADSSAEVLAEATGFAGDEGDDAIEVGGTLDVTATSDALSTSFSWGTFGAGVANSGNTSRAEATGLHGGDDDDALINRSLLNSSATANATGKSFSITGLGFGSGSVATTATSIASGLVGGNGDDLILNFEDLTATGTADVRARSFNLTGTGVQLTDASATANANAIGLSGEAGNNEILNQARITAFADSYAEADGVALGFIGYASSRQGTDANAAAFGIRAGNDDDLIINDIDGVLDVDADAETVIDGISLTLLGGAGLDPTSEANATGKGIESGAGEDLVINLGDIDVDVHGIQRTSGNSLATLSAQANATMNGALLASGIDAGDDDDTVVNEGDISLYLLATLDSDAASWALTGGSSVTAGMTSDSRGFGIVGGSGSDLLLNAGSVGVGLDFEGTVESTSWLLAGSANDTAGYASDQLSVGMTGGDGDDHLENTGSIIASTFSDLGVIGGANVLLGVANGDAGLTTTSRAIGMSGDGGEDVLANFGSNTVGATAKMSVESAAFSFIGSSDATATLVALAATTGLSGGDGDDEIANLGSIDVRSLAEISSSGGTITVFGDGAAATATSATVDGVGISGGIGDDLLFNSGNVGVRVTAKPNSSSESDAIAVIQVPESYSDAESRVTAVATGLDSGDGNSLIVNEGSVSALSDGIGRSSARSLSVSGTVSDALSNAATGSRQTVRGIVGADGDNQAVNFGTIEARARDLVAAYAESLGSAVKSNSGSNGVARSDGDTAIGIEFGNGDNRVHNDGTLTAVVEVRVDADSNADSIGYTPIRPSTADGVALATANGAVAAGIRVGDGDNVITNDGAITAEASPEVLSEARGNYAPGALIVDSTATATARADNVKAWGILSGNGDDQILNAGAISATASPSVVAAGFARGFGYDGAAIVKYTATADNALAVGIDAGNGDNTVINEGTIMALASPTATGYGTAIAGKGALANAGETVVITVCGWQPDGRILGRLFRWACKKVEQVIEAAPTPGEATVDPEVSADGAQAIGIRTGSGSDFIVNTGSIMASLGGDAKGTVIGITTGSGNDEVRLGDGSFVGGDILLGEDNDKLALWGTPVVAGVSDGGAGSDTLQLNGAGSFSGQIADFENIVKRFGGRFAIADSLAPMQLVQVDSGTLAFTNNYYAMSNTSVFATQVNADGSHGRFEVNGGLWIDGTLSVAKDEGLFTNGTRYSVIDATTVANSFDTLDLPDATPLLSFSVDQSATGVDVVANAASFATLMPGNNSMGESMGVYLDSLTDSATGDLEVLLASLQHSNDIDQVRDTLGSLTPSDREDTIAGGFAAIRKSQDAVQARLDAVRDGANEKSSLLGGNSVVNVFSNDGFNPASAGAWAATMSYDGGRPGAGDRTSAFASQNYILGGGIDMPLGSNGLVGTSVFSTFSVLAHGRANDFGELRNMLGSIYGAYGFDGGAYVQGVVSAGSSDYRAIRNLDNAYLNRIVDREHGGDVVAANVEYGRLLWNDGVRHEVFAGLNFLSLKDSGFVEKGAGDFGFVANGSEARSLISEVGLRSSAKLDFGRGYLRPEITVAWLHEHEVGSTIMTGHLAGAPDSTFRFRSGRGGEDGYRVTMGVDLSMNMPFKLSLKWHEERLGDYDDSTLSANFRWKF